MKISSKYAVLLCGALMLSAGAGLAAGVKTDAKGMTLYTFDKDSGGVSACYDDCAVKWPPYLGNDGDAMTEGWTLVARTDGTMQWAYDGKPTYFFQGDAAKGDMAGDGLGGVWHVIAE